MSPTRCGRLIATLVVYLALAGCSGVPVSSVDREGTKQAHFIEFAATLTAEVPTATVTATAQPTTSPTATSTSPAQDDETIVSLMKLTIRYGGVEPEDVLIVEAPPEDGGRTCVVAWKVPAEYTVPTDLLPSLGSIFGSVAGANIHQGAAFDTVLILAGNQEGKALFSISVPMTDVEAFLDDRLTEVEFIARWKVINS